MSNFYDKNFVLPDKKDQMVKLKQGANKFRFVGAPITGFVHFVELTDDKGKRTTPLRQLEPFTAEQLSSITPSQPGSEPKFFFMTCVYCYDDGQFRFLELTQKSILNVIKSFASNDEYGNPSGYDITIKKEGENLNTEYWVIPSPPKPLAKNISDQLLKLKYDLNLVFDGEYPAASFPFVEKEGKVEVTR
jgi:hypothetical protein